MDLNSGFRLFETQGSSGRPFSSQKGRLRTEKLYKEKIEIEVTEYLEVLELFEK